MTRSLKRPLSPGRCRNAALDVWIASFKQGARQNMGDIIPIRNASPRVELADEASYPHMVSFECKDGSVEIFFDRDLIKRGHARGNRLGC
jgi:hypothetical protein